MNDTLKILLNAQLRQWLLLLLGGSLLQRFGFAEEVIRFLRDTNLDYVTIVLGVGAAAAGVYTRLRSKTKQNIARELPAGTSQQEVDALVKAQPLTAVLSTKPVYRDARGRFTKTPPTS